MNENLNYSSFTVRTSNRGATVSWQCIATSVTFEGGDILVEVQCMHA